MSKAELARAVGVSKTAVGQWESGTTAPNRSRIADVAAVLQWSRELVDQRYVAEIEDVLNDQRAIEVVQWEDLLTAIATTTAAPPRKRTRAVKIVSGDNDLPEDSVASVVVDDAMTPYADGVGAIEIGDIVIVSRSTKHSRGCVVIAQLGSDEPILRQYIPRAQGAFDLVATNPDYPTVTVNKKQPGRILGVVIEHRRRLKR